MDEDIVSCPTCGKNVRHRKICPVQRRINQEEAKQRAIRIYQEEKERQALALRKKEQLERERNALREQYPSLVNYMDVLENKIETMEEQIKEMKYRLDNATEHREITSYYSY